MKKYIALLSAMVMTTSIQAQTIKPIVAQYFGIWTETSRNQQWEQKFRADTPFDKLTRIYIAFCKVVTTTDGHLTIQFNGDISHAVAIMDRVRSVNPSAEIFVAVVGEGGANDFGGAAKDPQFASNVRGFLAHYGLNGVDIDWEMGLNKNDLNLLTTNLAANLHPAGYKLTLDVWSTPSAAYDMNVLSQNLDQMNIMSYGRYTRLDQCANAYIQQGFPAEKLIGGVEVEIPYEGGNTDTLGPDGTLTQKANYVLSNGLAGIMAWRLDNDYPDADNLNYPTYKGANELWQIFIK